MATSPFDSLHSALIAGSRRRKIFQSARVLALALSLVAVADVLPASATTVGASQGNVTATLTYQKTYPAGGNSGPPEARNALISINVAGHLAYRAAVYSSVCGRLCWPESTSARGSALRVVRLAPGSPDVVLSLYSGGAHCCFIDQIFSPGAGGLYSKTEMNFGDPGARLEALPGNPYAAIVTADDAFAYAFTDFAASGLPIRVLRYGAHRFTNVTRNYPSLVRTDAALWLKAFNSQAASKYQDSVGVIAAWAADEYLLGNSGGALSFLHQQAAAGHLNSLVNPAAQGASFVAMLQQFLQREGY